MTRYLIGALCLVFSNAAAAQSLDGAARLTCEFAPADDGTFNAVICNDVEDIASCEVSPPNPVYAYRNMAIDLPGREVTYTFVVAAVATIDQPSLELPNSDRSNETVNGNLKITMFEYDRRHSLAGPASYNTYSSALSIPFLDGLLRIDGLNGLSAILFTVDQTSESSIASVLFGQCEVTG